MDESCKNGLWLQRVIYVYFCSLNGRVGKVWTKIYLISPKCRMGNTAGSNVLLFTIKSCWYEFCFIIAVLHHSKLSTDEQHYHNSSPKKNKCCKQVSYRLNICFVSDAITPVRTVYTFNYILIWIVCQLISILFEDVTCLYSKSIAVMKLLSLSVVGILNKLCQDYSLIHSTVLGSTCKLIW